MTTRKLKDDNVEWEAVDHDEARDDADHADSPRHHHRFLWLWTALCALLWRYVVEQIVWLIVRERTDGLLREQFHITTAPLCFHIDQLTIQECRQQQRCCVYDIERVSFYVRRRLLQCSKIAVCIGRPPPPLPQRDTEQTSEDDEDPWFRGDQGHSTQQFQPSSALVALVNRLRSSVLLAGCSVQVQQVVVSDDRLLVCKAENVLLALAANEHEFSFVRASVSCGSETIATLASSSIALYFDDDDNDLCFPRVNVRLQSINISLVESLSLATLRERYLIGNDSSESASSSRSLGLSVWIVDVERVDAKLFAGERCTALSLEQVHIEPSAVSFSNALLAHELAENSTNFSCAANQFNLKGNSVTIASVSLALGQRQIGRLHYRPSSALEAVFSDREWRLYTALQLDTTAEDAYFLYHCSASLCADLALLVGDKYEYQDRGEREPQEITILSLYGFHLDFCMRDAVVNSAAQGSSNNYNHNSSNSSLSLHANFSVAQITIWQHPTTVVQASQLLPTFRVNLSLTDLAVADRVEHSHYRYALFFEDDVHIDYLCKTRFLPNATSSVSLRVNLGETVALCLHCATVRFLTRVFHSWSDIGTAATTTSPSTTTNNTSQSSRYERIDITPCRLVINYKPDTASTYSNIVEHGQFSYALGSAVPIEDAVLHCEALEIVDSEESLATLLKHNYLPQWDKVAASLCAGVQPLRIALNLGDAVIDLVRLPLKAAHRGDSIADASLYSLQSVAVEVLTLGSRIGTVGYKALGGKRQQRRNDIDSRQQGFEESEQHASSSSTSSSTSSFSGSQPRNFRDGRRQAWRILRDNCASALFAVTSDPARTYTHHGSVALTALSVARGLPRLVTRPLAGVAGAVVKLSQGAKNKIDSKEKEKSDRKWR